MAPSILPTHSGQSTPPSGYVSSSSNGAGPSSKRVRSFGMGGIGAGMIPRRDRGLPLLFRRMTKFKSMDFELAFWQLTYLVVAPRRVYKQTYHHKQTKNVWARDDPAILLLISGCLVVVGTIWSLVYRLPLSGAISIILRMLFRDFLFSSIAIATVLYVISNKLLLSPGGASAVSENRVEFSYAFDVAVNSFFPAFLSVYVALLVLAPVVVKDNWICLWVGNTLFLVAGIQYVYVTYLGYAALPFVARSEILLSPLLPIFGGYLLSLLGFNIARHALELYFGQVWK